MDKKKLAMFAVIGVAFAVMGAWVGVNQKQPEPRTATYLPTPEGKPHKAVDALFATTLNDPAGKPEPLSQYKGQLLVVNFWAPWCAPCVQEMPELSTLAAEHGKAKVIGIGIDSPSNISEFAGKHKIAFPLYTAGMDGTDLARNLGNVSGGLPFTVVIGADGQVKKTYLGRLKFDQFKADLATM
ncbi:TlpA family protein disulfide reductase [Pseudoduganella sp. GCM10020061]|uniref:TlpA family protein disulfide reductase n=1 Tax=Pseudoduganella sp. GCM10020061 TaxID=3317345 RepID=UPI0036356149